MTPRIPYIAPADEASAIATQEQLARHINTQASLGSVERIAGVDVAYEERDDGTTLAHAGIVVLDADTLAVVEYQTAHCVVDFPYVSGLFAFRELPAVIAACAKLAQQPDVFVCDAHGIAHRRGCGMASHFGVLFDVAVIGCAKTPASSAEFTLQEQRGESVMLGDGNGIALRTQSGIKPVYVSVGHNITLDAARDWVLHLTQRYRLPETTRHADQLVNAVRKGQLPHWATLLQGK